MVPTNRQSLRVVVQHIGESSCGRSSYRLIGYSDAKTFEPVEFESPDDLLKILKAALPDFDAASFPKGGQPVTSILFADDVELSEAQLAVLGYSAESSNRSWYNYFSVALWNSGVWWSGSHSIQSSPNNSTGCGVRIVPFPQRRSSAEQYLSQPQQIRSGCFGLSAVFGLFTVPSTVLQEPPLALELTQRGNVLG